MTAPFSNMSVLVLLNNSFLRHNHLMIVTLYLIEVALLRTHTSLQIDL